MDKEKLKKLQASIASIERASDNGQELARSSISKEPGQRSQNIYWRNVKQDLRDIKKLLSEDN